MSVHVLRTLLTQARVYIGSFCITLVKQAVYRNYPTVRGVAVLNLKLKSQLESHAVYRDYANEYSLALHQAKMEANKTSQSLLSLG